MTVADDANGDDALLSARVRVPDHVVYRSFAAETVVLNLETGLYHGLNLTAGRMLGALDELGSVEIAAETLAGEYERPIGDVQRDLCKLCEALLDRRLLVIESQER